MKYDALNSLLSKSIHDLRIMRLSNDEHVKSLLLKLNFDDKLIIENFGISQNVPDNTSDIRRQIHVTDGPDGRFSLLGKFLNQSTF